MALLWSMLTCCSVLLTGGRVRDARTRSPITGVAVHAIGSARGTMTDSLGRWHLETGDGVRLRFSRTGYAELDVPASSDTLMDVLLVPSVRSLEGVTITALRAEGGDATAPISQRIVRRGEIEQHYSGQEMPLLLTATPSVTSSADGGAYSNYTYMRLRGIDQTRINITLDGVPLNDAEDEGVFFSNFPDFGNSIESVQIQRGVGTSSQGTAPYAGSINFESISLERSSRRGEVQLSRGAFATTRGAAEWQSGVLPNGFAMYGRLSSQQTDGYRHHAGNRSAGGFLSAGYFGSRTSVKMTALTGVSRNQEAYLASSLPDIERDRRDNPLTDAERDHFTQSMVSVALTRLVGAATTVSATAYTVGAGGDYDVLIAPALQNFSLESRVTGAFATWNHQSGRLTVNAGVHGNAYYRDHVLRIHPDLATEVYRNRGRRDEESAFGKAAWDAGRWSLFADVQWRGTGFDYLPDANAGVSDEQLRWSFLNPKVGITRRFGDRTALYASLGANGREPARNDLLAGFDNLDTSNVAFVGPLQRVHPEHVLDLESGFNHRGSVLAASVNLFTMSFRNEIAPIGALSYIGLPLRKNVHRSSRSGVEGDVRWNAGSGWTLAANATVSRNRIAEYTDDASGQTYHDVEPLLTPRLVSNQSATWDPTRWLSLQLEGRWVGRSFLANTSDGRFVTPAWYAADLGATARRGNVQLLLQLRNLGNARAYTGGYTDGTLPYYYVMAARNLMVTTRVGL